MRRFLKIAVPILLILAAALWWLTTVYMPPKLKAIVCETMEQRLGRRVAISDIKYNLFKGIVLKDLTIFEMDQAKEFLKIKETSFTIFPFALLKKKIFITNLRINQATVNLVLNKPGEWNFSDILDRLEERPNPNHGFSIVVSGVAIRKGEIGFVDLVRSPKFSARFSNLNGDLQFSMPDAIRFNLSGKLSDQTTTFAAQGRYRLAKRDLALSISSKDLILTDYSTYYQKFLPFQVEGGTGELAVEYLLEEDVVKLGFVSSMEGIDLKRANLQSRGDLQTAFDITYKLTRKVELEYKGNATLKDIEIMGMPFAETISRINGNIKFCKDRIWTEDLKGMALGFPIRVTGDIKDFRNPLLDLLIKSDIELSEFKASLPAQFEATTKSIDAKGKGLLTINLKGKLRDPSRLEFSGKATLYDATLICPPFPDELKNIDANISFKRDLISTQDLTLAYKDKRYKLTGALKNFALPEVELELTSSDLSLNCNFRLLKDRIKISKAKGTYLNSSFELGGDLLPDKGLGYQDPIVDFNGQASVDLLSLRELLPDVSDHLSKLDLKGQCDLATRIKGRWKEPKLWEMNLKATSPSILIKGFKFDRFFCDLCMEKGRISIVKLTSNPYQGKLDSTLTIDLQDPMPRYALDLNLINCDLKRLAQHPSFGWKDISGYLTGKVTLDGYGKDLEKIKGKGWLMVGEGELWEVPLFMELGNILYFPNLGRTKFKEGFASFIIVDKSIITRDLILHGEGMDLLADGTLGFDGSLDFTVTAKFSEELAQKSGVRKIGMAIISEIWRYIVDLKLSGTIQRPKFTIVARLDKLLIEKMKDLFR